MRTLYCRRQKYELYLLYKYDHIFSKASSDVNKTAPSYFTPFKIIILSKLFLKNRC